MYSSLNSAAADAAEIAVDAVIVSADAEGLLSDSAVVGYRAWYAVYLATGKFGVANAASYWAPRYSAAE
jgi:hypothetical protein